MKKMIKLATLLCLLLLAVVLMTTTVFAAEAPDAVVYVDAVGGDDANDGLTEATAVKTIKPAYVALASAMDAKGLKSDATATGKIVFVSDYLFNTFSSSSTQKDFGSGTHKYRVILEGKTPQTSLQFHPVKQSYVGMMGPTTIQNLNVRLTDNPGSIYLSIHGRGGSLIIGEGVTTSDNPDRRPTLSAGPYFNSTSNAYLEINSGDWRNVYAGCYHKTLTGSGKVVLNGGTVARLGGTYTGTITKNAEIIVNGGTVGLIQPTANASGTISGTATFTINGGTVTGAVENLGTAESWSISIAGNDVALTYSGNVPLTNITASKLFLGSNTRVTFAQVVTGPVAVTVDKAVRYNVPYITAPADTADDAFTFSQKEMTPTVSGTSKAWINANASEFTGLVLKAPQEFTVKLYTGTQDGSQVTPDKTEIIDGIKYQYFANIMGTYRYVTSRTGYYTLTKPIWMSEEKSLTQTVVDASSGKRDNIGWEPTSVKDYSDETHTNIIPQDETALWWDDYSPLLVSPYFTDTTRAEHRATTQEEMENFLASLDDANDNMYIYSLGTSSSYGLNIPIVVFTKVDLSGAKTLEEAAALVRADNKLVIHYQAQIHGNEPAGGEAALNHIARLDGEWGDDLLDTINCYVIPRVNPDGAKNYTRANASGVNLNRDMVLATMPETAALRYACDIFQPDLNIDGHEYLFNSEKTSGTYIDLMCSSGVNGNYSAEYIEVCETISRRHYQTFYDYGMQPGYYSNKANNYSPATNSGYHSTRGSLHFLMESRGIGGGNNNMTRRVVSHLIVAESIFEYAAENHETITRLVDAERARFARIGGTYEEDDVINLHFENIYCEEMSYPLSKWDYVSGTLTSVDNNVPIIYRDPKEGMTRPRPTAYVFHDGEDWTQDVLDCLDAHDIRYYRLPAGTMLKLRQMTGVIDDGSLGTETFYGFENGCYVVPMNQPYCLLASYIFEPDICGYSPEEGYGSLVQMSVIPAYDNCFPVYHYVHDLEADGTVATYTGAAAPTGLKAVNPAYVGDTGSITGLDASKTYAYRSSKSAEYITVSGVTAIEELAVGTWYVRYTDDTGTAYRDAKLELSYGDIKQIVVYLDQLSGDDTNTGFTEAAPVATLEGAIAALNAVVGEDNTGKVVLLSDYDMGTAAYTFPSHSYTVTYTGKTADIALVKTGGTTQAAASVSLGGPSIFQNITIKNSTSASYNNFNCRGFKTVFYEDVTCVANSKGKHFMLAAGSYNAACASTDLTVLSGNWNMIYAGGYLGGVTGDAKLTVRNATVAGQIMAAYSGAIGGNITYDIADTTAGGIYLGIGKTNDVGGNITATIGTNTSFEFLYAGNRDSGNVTGTVHVIAQNADLTDATLYGTSKTSGEVGKSILTNRGSTLGTVIGFDETNVQEFTGIYHIYLGGEQVQTCYTFSSAAEAAGKLDNAIIRLGSDAMDTAVVPGGLVLDLAGYSLSGITVDGIIYGMDSTTDGYTCQNVGTLTLKAGTVAAHVKDETTLKRYMAIEEENGYTFHRFYMGITHMNLKPDATGVGYKAAFYGDEQVQAQVIGYGYILQLGENGKRLSAGKEETFVSGQTVTARLQNFDVENYGETAVIGRVYLTLKDGTVIESTACSYTLRSLVEQVAANASAFTEAQLSALRDMLARFESTTSKWNIEGIV